MIWLTDWRRPVAEGKCGLHLAFVFSYYKNIKMAVLWTEKRTKDPQNVTTLRRWVILMLWGETWGGFLWHTCTKFHVIRSNGYKSKHKRTHTVVYDLIGILNLSVSRAENVGLHVMETIHAHKIFVCKPEHLWVCRAVCNRHAAVLCLRDQTRYSREGST
jgi:hypothetical protein